MFPTFKVTQQERFSHQMRPTLANFAPMIIFHYKQNICLGAKLSCQLLRNVLGRCNSKIPRRRQAIGIH